MSKRKSLKLKTKFMLYMPLLTHQKNPPHKRAALREAELLNKEEKRFSLKCRETRSLEGKKANNYPP